MSLSKMDMECFWQAKALAIKAGESGNLPIGAVIQYENIIIGEGKNSIWKPELRLNQHAEMEALKSVSVDLWPHASKMTLYTTLEPCLMCMGAILLYGIGHVFFGSSDPFGGAGTVIGHLPAFFRDRHSETSWIGPAWPEECDSLYEQIKVLEKIK
jgi:tRNA(adenine34) deaminase